MGWLNASTGVLKILFWILGVLYIIAGAFLVIFLPPAATLTYAGHWAIVALGVATFWVAGHLAELIARKSRIPDLLLVAMIGVRLFTGRESLYGGEGQPKALLFLGIALLVSAYLWTQVRRLQRTAEA